MLPYVHISQMLDEKQCTSVAECNCRTGPGTRGKSSQSQSLCKSIKGCVIHVLPALNALQAYDTLAIRGMYPTCKIAMHGTYDYRLEVLVLHYAGTGIYISDAQSI